MGQARSRTSSPGPPGKPRRQLSQEAAELPGTDRERAKMRKRFAAWLQSRPLWQFALITTPINFALTYIIWLGLWAATSHSGQSPLNAAVVFTPVLTVMQIMQRESSVVEPVRRSASWTRSGTPEGALSAVEDYGISHRGRVNKSPTLITLTFGSRLAFRLMGVSAGRRPYTVRVTAADSQGTVTELTAEALSDERGPYFFRTPVATRLYEQLLSQTLSELQEL